MPPLYARRVLSRRRVLTAAAGTSLLPLVAACSPSAGTLDPDQLRIMVPNAAGGGYDTTARILAGIIEDEGLGERPEIFNLEGASGGAGLARTAHERGNGDLMMMMGLGVVGSLHTNRAAVGLDEVTPVARLLSEPEIVMVREGSPHRDLASLVKAWKRDPARLRIGGGSLPGGPDHLATHLLAEAVGIDPREVRYRVYDGGGPTLAALFTGRIEAALSGVLENIDQVRAGAVRVLAVTGDQPVPGIDAPTLRDAGVPLGFANWRGLVAPPGLSPGQRDRLADLVDRVHDTSAWREAEQANGWTDDYLTGSAFGRFLMVESDRVGDVLDRLGV
jgi:putative tricarboxylic transport membrane protein